MVEEIPELQKLFVLGYDASDPNFPIIGIHQDPISQDVLPALGSACPDPDNKFTAWKFVGADVTKWDSRMLWKYMNLPGPFTQTDKVDEKNDSLVSTYKRQNVHANINPGAYVPAKWAATTAFTEGSSVIGGTGVFVCSIPGTTGSAQPTWPASGAVVDGSVTWKWVCPAGVAWQASNAYTVPQQVIGSTGIFEVSTAGTSGSSAPSWPTSGTVSDGGVTWTFIGSSAQVVVDRQDVNEYISEETWTVYPSPANNSLATAFVEEVTESISFPGLCNWAVVNSQIGGGEGIVNLDGRPQRAQNLPVKLLTYWVATAIKPTVAWDTVAPTDVFFSRSDGTNTTVAGAISNVLHDGYTLVLTSGNIIYPATVPSYSDYKSSWIGQLKNIKGSITTDKYLKFWKVQIYSVVMQ